ncbi:MAG: phosphoribosylformylglycinamidine synthase subunit PurQ [Chthonomonadales bacterium]|nr:phosphoribosylformylglycinamidine synthase subunit PurQ [Chthonomonadales bacterium]
MKFGVIRFPGSNCDQDAYFVVRDVLKQPVDYIWHQETSVKGYDCIILPGGFSYGDYLRTGAIARFSPVMSATQEFAERGGLVIGICNGFQVLCEAHLLPGALIRNVGLKFRCRQVQLRVDNADTPWTCATTEGQVLTIPIAHGEGCYVADADTLAALQANRQIVFRYCDESGAPDLAANPNGSMLNIAGVCNPTFNVLGMMPHPERASESILGSADGRRIFESVLQSVQQTGGFVPAH